MKHTNELLRLIRVRGTSGLVPRPSSRFFSARKPRWTKAKTEYLPAALVLVLLGGVLLWSGAERLGARSPRIYLWAWERPEELAQADPAQVGVAYLAETIRLFRESAVAERRRQPLSVARGSQVMTMVRIQENHAHRPALDQTQQQAVTTLLDELVERRGLNKLQIDFDATVSQRDFYRGVLLELRSRHPKLHVSITALASWCLADPWIHGLPVDEAVPMLFRMGPDARVIHAILNEGGDFQQPLCRHSYGLSLDEPVPKLPERRTIYWFNPQSWTRDEISMVTKRW